MAYSADQLEKHTIVLRLAVSIHKMNDQQLTMLLEALEQDETVSGNRLENYLESLVPEKNDVIKRQMYIGKIFVLIKRMDKDEILARLRPLNQPGFRWVREYPRLTCYLLVDFTANGKAYRSCIRDISASGVFIETSDQYQVDQEVAMCFAIEESNDSIPFKVMGRVAQIYPDGIGVHYENVTHYQREILNTLINKGYAYR